MFRAKFWHSSKLARKQAYNKVAKASLLQTQVLASPDPAYFISLLPQHHSLKGSFVPEARVYAWVGALRALCALFIDCDDLIFRTHPFYPHHHCMEALHCPGMQLSGHITATRNTIPELSFQSEEKDGQGSQMPEIRPLALARSRRGSSDHQRDFPSAPNLNQVCTPDFKGCNMKLNKGNPVLKSTGETFQTDPFFC